MPKFTDDEIFEIHQKLFPNGNPSHMMSKDTKDKLNNIEQELKDVKIELSHQDVKSAERAKDIEFIKETLERIENTLKQVIKDKNDEHEKINTRIGRLEVRVAVFTAIGTLIGSFLGPLVQQLILK